MNTNVMRVALGLWAALACAGTYLWASMPPVKEPTAITTAAPDTASVTIAVTGSEGTHYLNMKIEYEVEPQIVRDAPVEAAMKDILIDAAHREAALTRADGWRTAVETVLTDTRKTLGVRHLQIVRAERLPAP